MEPKKVDWRAILIQVLISLLSGLAGGATGSQIVTPANPPAQTMPAK